MRDIIHHNDYAIIIVDLNDTKNMFVEKATSFYGTLFFLLSISLPISV